MSTRHFDRLFTPRSVAIVGATERAGSVGSVVTRNLIGGGFAGPIYAVNPSRQSVHGLRAWPSVAALPETPDLAVIATPPDAVPDLVAQLSDKGNRAAVVLTAGFGEGGDAVGRERLARALAAARPGRLRLVGPNCLGLLVPGIRLNASFAHIGAVPGGLAFVSQSGAIATAVLDWAAPRDLGFSHIVSMGTMADVDFGDLLEWLTQDSACRAVLLYVEAVSDARKFLSAARACARVKPVVVVKAGRSAEGARAARSHTGALAGSDSAYDAAFRRAGMLRVSAVDELFAAAETLAKARAIAGDRLAVLTNGGGFGVLAADALAAAGGRLATLDPVTVAALDRALPPTWSHGNPVDIIGDANAARYRAATEALLADAAADALLVINCPTAVASSVEAARAVAAAASASDRPVLTSWVGEAVQREARTVFADARIPTYDTPEAAVRAFAHMVAYRRNQEALRQVPHGAPVDVARERARAIVEAARAAGRAWLSGPDARSLLACYGVPVNPILAATTAEEAARAATSFVRVALKIDSPDIVHKSDVGGVMLDVAPDEVSDAASRLVATVRSARPEARIEGVTVEPMASVADAIELIVGAARDADFGPLILFGEGGTRVEIAADRAVGLPPLNLALARDMMGRTLIDRLLAGYRGVAAADREAVARVLVAVAEIAVDLPEVAELDINPLLASAAGVLALDARVRLQDPALAVAPAIRPYPRELERSLALRDGTALRLRPARPEDEAALAALFAATSPEDVRLSAFSALEGFADTLAARLTQIDYDREVTLIAFAGDAAIGVAHLRMDADRERAEYGVIVRSDAHGRGIGTALLTALVGVARANGVGEVFGTVQSVNRPMLELADEIGFASSPWGEGLVCTTLRLRAPPPG